MDVFTHLLVGIPGISSCRAYLCRSITSTCIKDHRYEELCCILPSKYFSKLFSVLVEALSDEVVHSYRYGGSTIYVLRGSMLCTMLRTLEDVYRIYVLEPRIGSKDKVRRVKRLEELVLASLVRSNASNRLNNVVLALRRFAEMYERRKIKGIESLTKRFRNRGKLYRKLFLKYFNEFVDGRNIAWLHLYECSEWGCWYDDRKAVEILTHLGMDSDRAQRYAWFIDRVRNLAILIWRNRVLVAIPDRIEALELNNEFAVISARSNGVEMHIVVDDAEEHRGFIAFKLVAFKETNKEIHIDYVAIAGFDKYTRSRFLHYVPPTLWNRSVEVCRKWILGLVNNYGKELYEEYELIEV